MTRAFTGRRARGLENRFIRAHDNAPAAPENHHMTRPIRAAAFGGDNETTNLWAGTGYKHARQGAAIAAGWPKGL